MKNLYVEKLNANIFSVTFFRNESTVIATK